MPRHVVVRATDDATTVVEAFDPDAMLSFAGADAAGDVLRTVAADARERFETVLDALGGDR